MLAYTFYVKFLILIISVIYMRNRTKKGLSKLKIKNEYTLFIVFVFIIVNNKFVFNSKYYHWLKKNDIVIY